MEDGSESGHTSRHYFHYVLSNGEIKRDYSELLISYRNASVGIALLVGLIYISIAK